MKLLTKLFLICSLGYTCYGQELPYREIPSYPKQYTAGTTAGRLIDGLGFRFYWATEGLRAEDLAYRPGEEARSSEETIAHIYSMSFIILNAVRKQPTLLGSDNTASFAAMRKTTLENLYAASKILKSCSDQELNEFKMVFKRGDTVTEYPFWNALNGPIADCLWHVGQIVSFRRASGNPFTDKVSVLSGSVRQ